MLSKDEIYELYIIQNKPRTEMLKILGIGITAFKRMMRKYNIRKDPKLSHENGRKTCLERYGVESYTSTEICKIRVAETIKNRTPEEQDIINQRRKQTVFKKYGVENVNQNIQIKNKIKQTSSERYGGIGFASKELNDKVKAVVIEKYGVDNPSKSEEIKAKKIATQKKNKAFHKSSHEEYIYDKLVQKFTDVRRQYRSKLYPFACDFYIPELDLYIEHQGTWRHGKYSEKKIYGLYNPNNPEHQKILKIWQEKADAGSKNYAQAINTWTRSDPLKRETAKKNNLNWIEFFTINEFDSWYSTI